MQEILYGRNAVRESLRARRRHAHRLLLAKNIKTSGIISDIIDLARTINIPIQEAPRKELDKIARGHQGVALVAGGYPTVDWPEIAAQAAKQNEPSFIIVLDHLEDPHNLGAILRTAEIVGVHGAIIPKQRAASVTPAVVNASAGAAEHVWVAEVTNVTRTLNKLKQHDIWIAGLEARPEATPYHQANLSGALAVVVGSEGQGMSRLVRETCDFLVRLPMRGNIESLNASVASALLLYEVWRAREFR